jgi:hypothetical protein
MAKRSASVELLGELKNEFELLKYGLCAFRS